MYKLGHSLNFREQELSNLLHAKKFTEALDMAISLEKPFLALNVIKSM